MDKGLIKKILSCGAALLLVVVAYYGSYLPFKKSQTFIGALRSPETSKSIDSFERLLGFALKAPSPIGQEELVRNAGNMVMDIVRSSDGNPEFIKRLTDFLKTYYQPIIERGRGMSFTQNLYLLGALHELAALKFNEFLAKNASALDEKSVTAIKVLQGSYIEDAKGYFLAGKALSPTRPQFLYGLLDIYRIENDRDQVRAIGAQILSQWPNDDRTRQVLKEFLEK